MALGSLLAGGSELVAVWIHRLLEAGGAGTTTPYYKVMSLSALADGPLNLFDRSWVISASLAAAAALGFLFIRWKAADRSVDFISAGVLVNVLFSPYCPSYDLTFALPALLMILAAPGAARPHIVDYVVLLSLSGSFLVQAFGLVSGLPLGPLYTACIVAAGIAGLRQRV